MDKCPKLDGEMIVRAAETKEYVEICGLVDKAFKSDLERKIIEVTTGEDTNRVSKSFDNRVQRH